MKEALRLHEAGVNAHAAARKAGVLPSSFYRLRNVMEANAQGTFASWPIDVLRAKVREGYESELLEPETIIECYEATAIIFG